MNPVIERVEATCMQSIMHTGFCNKGGSFLIKMRNTGTNTKLLNETPHLVFQDEVLACSN